MWETIALILAGLAMVLLVWLVVLLGRMKKIRFRFRSQAAEEIEKIREVRGLKIEELRERVQPLEAGYRFFFEEAQTYNVVLDREGRVRDINRAFLNLFDREKSDLEGVDFLELAAPEERSGLEEYLRAHQKNQYTPEREVGFAGPRGNRRILFGERHLTVVEDSVPAGIMISGIDVTARRRVEAGEEDLKKRLALSARMETLGIMAGGIAHDLKNLFNPVLSYPDFIADRLPPESELRGPVTRIKKAAAQAAELVQNFLALARRGKLELQPLDLNAVVRSYIQSLGFKTLEDRFPRARVRLDLASDLPPVMGLAPQLLSVLMNLVKNGCEAMEEGGEIVVATFVRRLTEPHRGYQQIPRGDYAVLQVEDSGKGMGAEEARSIFAPFTSGKEMGSSGTGLGMVVVAGVVEDHQGYIDVRSKPGEGTAVMLYFRAPEGRADETSSSLGRGERILVVDDDDADRRETARRLFALGYEVAQAADGKEALGYVRRHPVALVIMDLVLDNENGIDIYRRIMEIIPRARCVMVSGGLDQRAREEAAALGITGVLEKPAGDEELARVVREELEKASPPESGRI